MFQQSLVNASTRLSYVEAAAAEKDVIHHTCTAISEFVGVFYERNIGQLLVFYSRILPMHSGTNLT